MNISATQTIANCKPGISVLITTVLCTRRQDMELRSKLALFPGTHILGWTSKSHKPGKESHGYGQRVQREKKSYYGSGEYSCNFQISNGNEPTLLKKIFAACLCHRPTTATKSPVKGGGTFALVYTHWHKLIPWLQIPGPPLYLLNKAEASEPG